MRLQHLTEKLVNYYVQCKDAGRHFTLPNHWTSFDNWRKFTFNCKEGHWIKHIDFIKHIIQIVDGIMNLVYKVI